MWHRHQGAPSWLCCLHQHLLTAQLQRTFGSSWLFLEHLLRVGASSLALHRTRVLCYQFALIWGIKWIGNTLVSIKGDWPAGFSKVWESEQQSREWDLAKFFIEKLPGAHGEQSWVIWERLWNNLPEEKNSFGTATINRCFILLAQSEHLIFSPSSQAAFLCLEVVNQDQTSVSCSAHTHSRPWGGQGSWSHTSWCWLQGSGECNGNNSKETLSKPTAESGYLSPPMWLRKYMDYS